jgi:hypothetical protein
MEPDPVDETWSDLPGDMCVACKQMGADNNHKGNLYCDECYGERIRREVEW